MTIIAAIQSWIGDLDLLASEALLSVDHLGTRPPQHSIVPQPGRRVVEEYLDGSSLREYTFAIQSAFYTADDGQRLSNSGFHEDVADTFERKTVEGDLPELGEGKQATKVEAVNAGFLMQEGESGTGIYQITCRLEYEQEPMENDESE